MLVWKGWGALVPLIYWLVTLAVREGLGRVDVEDDIAIAGGVVLSAIIVWVTGKKINDPARGKLVIDVETGEELLLQDSHSFFWIKIEYWAFVVPVVLGAIILANI